MGHLLHYMIPFQNLFQMLFMSLFTEYCWLQAITELSQHKRTKMLLFFMDIVGIYRPMWLFIADMLELFDNLVIILGFISEKYTNMLFEAFCNDLQWISYF